MKIDRLNCEVKIDGKVAQPSRVVVEQHSFCLPFCSLLLSGENRRGDAAGQSVSVSLNRKRIFSGSILGVGRERGGELLKCGHKLAPSKTNFRKEKAKYIFGDLVKQSKVEDAAAEIPDVEFPHFHCSGGGWANLMSFTKTLEDFSHAPYDLFFDSEGALNLIPMPSKGSAQIEFKRGVNALLIGYKRLKAFPIPLRYGDFIGISEGAFRVWGLRYVISPRDSLMEVVF